MEELFALRPGRYRHFKGNEYELLYVARHSRLWSRWWSTGLCMESGACGCVLLPCGASRRTGTAIMAPVFSGSVGPRKRSDGLQKYFSRFLKKGLLFAESYVIIHKLTSRSQPRIRV